MFLMSGKVVGNVTKTGQQIVSVEKTAQQVQTTNKLAILEMDINEDNHTTNDNMVDKGKATGPLMVLSSGKVVGNVGPQWKKFRDNRGKNNDKQTDANVTTRKEIIAVDKAAAQQDQITNTFAVLEVMLMSLIN